MSRAEWLEQRELRKDIYESYVRLAKETPMREEWTLENRDERHAKNLEALHYWRRADHWGKSMKFARTRVLNIWLEKERANFIASQTAPNRKRLTKPKPTKYVGRATVVYEPKTLPPVPPRPIPAGHYLG